MVQVFILRKLVLNLDQKNKESKDKKRDTYENACALREGQELTLNDFKIAIFAIKATQGKGLKTLTSKQML